MSRAALAGRIVGGILAFGLGAMMMVSCALVPSFCLTAACGYAIGLDSEEGMSVVGTVVYGALIVAGGVMGL